LTRYRQCSYELASYLKLRIVVSFANKDWFIIVWSVFWCCCWGEVIKHDGWFDDVVNELRFLISALPLYIEYAFAAHSGTLLSFVSRLNATDKQIVKLQRAN